MLNEKEKMTIKRQYRNALKDAYVEKSHKDFERYWDKMINDTDLTRDDKTDVYIWVLAYISESLKK